jgi:hypothetical protein
VNLPIIGSKGDKLLPRISIKGHSGACKPHLVYLISSESFTRFLAEESAGAILVKDD